MLHTVHAVPVVRGDAVKLRLQAVGVELFVAAIAQQQTIHIVFTETYLHARDD